MNDFFQDLRYAWRMMLKSPTFALITLLTVALGIGANTAVFTVFRATLLRRLPYQSPDRLVELVGYRTDGSIPEMPVSYPNFVDLRELNHSFSSIAAYSGTSATLSGPNGAEQIVVPLASSGFFETLGVKPYLGKTFGLEDEHAESSPSAILTYGAWQRMFGGDPGAIGKTIVLDGEPHSIIGVLPRSFQFGPSQSGEIWLGLRVHGWRVRRNATWLHPIGRLKPGVTRDAAQAEYAVLARQLERQYPIDDKGLGFNLVPFEQVVIGSVRPVLQLLMCTVGFLLLITCANVAGLLLARSVNRQREINVRVALGAGRTRIVRQLLTESLLLSAIGGALGVAIAYWTVPLIVSFIPKQQLLNLPSLHGIQVDGVVLLFGIGLSLLTGVLFGIAPALKAFRPDLVERLQQNLRVTDARAHNRLSNGLVTAEIALAVILLVGAGLMLNSLRKVLGTSPGFEAKNLLTLSVALPKAYQSKERQIQFQRDAIENINAIPGVQATAVVSIVPLSGSGNTSRFDVEGKPKASGGEEYEASSPTVSANYFRAMGIPLLSGRYFDEDDNERSKHVVIINQALAEQVFAGINPLGKRINLTYTKEPNLWEVVGVVGNERLDRLDAPPKPIFYDNFAQDPTPYFSIAVRTSARPEAEADSVSRAIHHLDSEIPVYDVQSMNAIISESPSMMLHGYPAYLLTFFAVLALLLSAMGIYGLLGYAVAQRTRELGVRMALGARPGDLMRMVLGSGLKLSVLGALIGIAGGFVVGRAMTSLLFEVKSTDPGTFIGVSVLMIGAALCASYLPARRAVEVDPMVALRYE